MEEQNRQLKEFIETIEAQRSTIEQLSTPVIPVIEATLDQALLKIQRSQGVLPD